MAATRRRISVLALFLALVLIAITVALAYRGYSFYKLSLEDRVEHPDFRKLRPSGILGNGYGWVAAMLVVLNLSYLIRRRFGGAKLGSMRAWLDVHVFTGLLAASLVSFHSAFQLRTPIATASTVSLGLVVFTGLIGRFLYALAPASNRERLRAALDAVERAYPAIPDEAPADGVFRQQGASTRTHIRDDLANAIASVTAPNVPQNASLLRSLFAIPGWRKASRERRRAIAMYLPPRKEQSRQLRRAIVELGNAAAADARSSGTAALLRSWRGLHRLFALVMLAAVFLHAGVAWYYGYRWIFS